MWNKSEKYLMIGVGYGIWACVIDGSGVSLMLSLVSFIYFGMSIYNAFKGG